MRARHVSLGAQMPYNSDPSGNKAGTKFGPTRDLPALTLLCPPFHWAQPSTVLLHTLQRSNPRVPLSHTLLHHPGREDIQIARNALNRASVASCWLHEGLARSNRVYSALSYR